MRPAERWGRTSQHNTPGGDAGCAQSSKGQKQGNAASLTQKVNQLNQQLRK